MTIDLSREFITGLEDDDNFYELVRQRAGLENIRYARRLICDVVLELAQQLPPDSARVLLDSLPKAIEDFVFPKLAPVPALKKIGSLARLESDIQRKWKVELETAARYVGAVGMSIVDRMSPIEITAVIKDLPLDLQPLFPPRSVAA